MGDRSMGDVGSFVSLLLSMKHGGRWSMGDVGSFVSLPPSIAVRVTFHTS